MKIGVITSTIAHTALLAFGALTIAAPKALEVADVEALPIDIIPISQFTRSIQGEKKAELADIPAPKPTLRPKLKDPASIVGDTKIDAPGERKAKAAPVPVKSVETPSAKPTPPPIPAPTSELAAEVQQKIEVASLPVENKDTQVAAKITPDEILPELPKNIPVPKSKPAQSKAQTAKTNKRKDSKQTPVKVAALAPDAKKKKNDEIAALLDLSKPKSGGAKRSTKRAALGTKKSNSKLKLSQSEMDALRGQIQRCWSISAGMADAEDLRVKVEIRLDKNGAIDGRPTVNATGGSKAARRAFAGSATRAVQRCAPYKLPREKYQDWAEVEVNFSLQDML